MATQINNIATLTYSFVGETSTNTIESNFLGINLEENSGMTLSKIAQPTNFAVGSIISYTVTITNSGNSYFNGVRVIDDLGGNRLAYVVGSAKLTTSNTSYAVTPIATNPLTFTLQQLAVGESMTLTYKAQVVFNLPSNVTTITNSVQGIGYTASSTKVGYANASVSRGQASIVDIVKSASVTDVVPNQNFRYYITISNSGSVDAGVSNITDNLPANFVLTSVSLKMGNGAETTLNSSEYTLSGSNVLVIPSASGPEIIVPASSSTIVGISGHFV